MRHPHGSDLVDQEVKTESRRELLSAALEKATSQPPQDTAQAKTEVSPPPVAEAAPQSNGRARDESGKFAKDEKKANGASVPPSSDAPKVEAVAVSEAKAARKYPSTWKRDYEPVYRKLEANPEYQSILDEIERREGDHLKQIGQYKPNVEFAANIRKTLEPYQQTFQRLNLPPEQAIQRLLQADHALRTAPENVRAGMAMQLLQSYGASGGPTARPCALPVAKPVAADASAGRHVHDFRPAEHGTRSANRNRIIQGGPPPP